MATLYRIFTYGSLKRGQPNHATLSNPANGLAKFIKTGKTVDKYPLIIATRFNIPFLLDVPGSGEQIVGEIYDVDEKMLKECDELEGHPDYYLRQLIDVEVEGDVEPKIEKVLCYKLPKDRFPPHLLSFPTMSCYDSEGDHGRPLIHSSSNEEEANDPDLIVSFDKH